MKLRQFTGLFLLGALSVGMLAGCGDSQASEEQAEKIDELTIVQMPDENNPDAGAKNDDFREALEKELGVKVSELEGSEYSVGIEAMKAGKLDVLLVSPMSYYQAKKVADVEPLVTTTTMGAEEYKTVFIVNGKDQETKSIEDLKGKSFAFVDPASSSGYMFPKAKLVKDLSLDTDKLENPDYFFKSVTYSGKHDSSVMGVVKGDYDAAAVAAQTIDGLVGAGMIEKDDVRIIGETDVIPNALYVIRKDLPEETKAAVKDFYLNYDNPEYFEALYGTKDAKFVEVDEDDYAVIEEMTDTLHLEEE
ncbi:MAG: phosphate/phosphite/phosphonate ABC transporter substrate-binding protein [Enterococcus sp.]